MHLLLPHHYKLSGIQLVKLITIQYYKLLQMGTDMNVHVGKISTDTRYTKASKLVLIAVCEPLIQSSSIAACEPLIPIL